ncbi:MAG TPA: MBL fold metallo-hydrolase [Firmicutes bacterium]|jgi:L-ascorbate metabolism protein UlaG (beta-lactamase superfamily)|nr:MBL fold metallo-hydrolase [Bacillota bacterium]
MEPTINLIKHAGVQILWENLVIYIDPWEMPESVKDKADLVLVTHPHYDHLSPEDIERIKGEDTVVIGPAGTAEEVAGAKEVAPGDKIEVKGIQVEAVPAYNNNKSFHEKKNNWVGYILRLGETRVYHAGDTDFIPEMADLEVDIALLPVGGTYTMNVEQAVQAAEAINPKVAIPMHYGDLVGNEEDGKEFARRFDRAKLLPKVTS